MSDDQKYATGRSVSPVASTSSRRKREDDRDEGPREKVSRKYSPPHGSSPVDEIKRERESSSTSCQSSRAGGDRERGDRERGDRERIDRERGIRAQRNYQILETRPQTLVDQHGTSGRRVRLQTNYFKLLKKPEWSIYQYRVDFDPPIEFTPVKRGLISEQKALLGGYLFDGSLLYVTRRLKTDLINIETKSRKGDEYKITIKFIAVVAMNEWQSLQILNLILRRAMEGLQLQLIGRNFFDALEKVNLNQYKIQLWPGYITSIRQHEKDILVCAEITHKVMRMENVYDIMRQCISNRRGGDWTEDFRRQVIGLTVLTDYNNKTYRIDDVDLTFKASMTFNMKGKSTTFVDYYYEKYKLRIRDPDQPLLASKNRDKRGGRKDEEENRIFLVPEFCRVTGITDSMRNDHQLMKEMANYTRTNPDRRIEKLKKFNRRLQETEASQQVLRDWNITLDHNLVQLEGRQLEPQAICFENNVKVPGTDRADWSNQFRDKGMYTVANLRRWVIIVPYKSKHQSREFISNLQKVAHGMHMNWEPPKEFTISDDRNHSYIQAIDNAARDDPKLILCLVPNKNTERYSSIKKKCCVERAIPTQVVALGTIANKGRGGILSIITKIAIQMNAKLGGAPWMVSLPMKGLMVIGYDICKSTKDRSKAYAALVATMDQKIEARYFSTVAQTHASDSLSNELNLAVGKAIHEYRRTHNCLPQKIVLYRDGVGNNALEQVKEHEVKNLVDFLENQYKKANLSSPRFTFIVVSKQINTRFFMNERNPLPGTVVDDVVTLPERYEFFLCSQSVRQGTVSPTSYNVLADTSDLVADRLQVLTYKMCHLYYNWAGTTRVPAVCQYAKKLATLVAQHLHQTPSHLLEKQLYYL